MTKRKFYTFFGLVMGPIIGFFAVLYIGASLMKLPLVLVVVFACLFAIYEFFIVKMMLRRVNWDI